MDEGFRVGGGIKKALADSEKIGYSEKPVVVVDMITGEEVKR
jgi:hypothetical protein